jgi:carboxylesterase
MESKPLILKRGAAPFLLDGGDMGCMCTHGFTASPEEMRWLGEYLNARGLTIFAPRLAGHGIDPALMRRQHRLDWYENVLDGVALLRARCRKVFALGLSMGGLLSLCVAAAGLVDAAVALATPFYVDRPLIRLTPVIKYFRRYFPKDGWPGALDERVRETQRRMGREETGRSAYPVIPTESAWQLYRLMGETQRRLPEITVPVLLIYSRGDKTVPYGNLALAVSRLRTADLVTRTLEHSDHVLPQEIERETVYETVWEFLSARLD